MLSLCEDAAPFVAEREHTQDLPSDFQRDTRHRMTPVRFRLLESRRPFREHDFRVRCDVRRGDRPPLCERPSRGGFSFGQPLPYPLFCFAVTRRGDANQVLRGAVHLIEGRPADSKDLGDRGQNPADDFTRIQRAHQFPSHRGEGAGRGFALAALLAGQLHGPNHLVDLGQRGTSELHGLVLDEGPGRRGQ